MTHAPPSLLKSPTLGRVGMAQTGPETGPSLVARLQDGSREAMDDIFRSYLDAIYNYCYRRTGSWSAAEDLAAAVFLEVWKGRRRAVERDGSVLPWLYGIATNVCRNHQRSQRRGSRAVSRLQLADIAPDPVDDSVVRQLDADRRLSRALDRLRQLPQADQDVFVLVCWEGLSYADTALALGIPIGTVRSRLSRVRQVLKLNDSENPDV